MKATRTCDGTCRPQCRECRRERDRKRRREDPDKFRARGWYSTYKKRAQQFGTEVIAEHFTVADVIGLYGNACVYCASGEFEELDHFKPICLGGTHTLANVRPSCSKCNAEKASIDGCPDDRGPGRWVRR